VPACNALRPLGRQTPDWAGVRTIAPEIDYESAAQDVEKLIIIVVFVPVVLALHYAEPDDVIVHPAERLIVPLVGDRLCELIDIDQSEGVKLYVVMRRVGKGFRFCHPQSPIVGSRGASSVGRQSGAHSAALPSFVPAIFPLARLCPFQ
jgi:hypothetical protein